MYEYYFEYAQTLGTVLNRGAQADARAATQLLDRFGQAVARGSCASQVHGQSAFKKIRKGSSLPLPS
jgi:lysophospholipid acyltransferase (LPLAT)-like uncharacterized protein